MNYCFKNNTDVGNMCYYMWLSWHSSKFTW